MQQDKFERMDKEIEGQTQEKQPGIESEMEPEPIYDDKNYKSSEKLKGRVAIITGGDSGIGRAVAVAFAKEGADVAIVYLDEHEDADTTLESARKYGVRALKIPEDVSKPESGQKIVDAVLNEFGQINILVNNAGKQFPQKNFLDISNEQLRTTFETNIYSMFYLTKAALPHFSEGDAIINTSSVTAYNGSPGLIDYSATKGAIASFTRSLALNLATKKIRVNAVAPGPIWTPLIPATFDKQKVESHGRDTPLKRRGQPSELAPAYVYLASADSTYVSGQTIHVDGADFVTS